MNGTDKVWNRLLVLAFVAAVLIAMTGLNQLTLAVAAVERPAFGAVTIQLMLTILIYPLIVGLSRSLFNVRRLAPGEIDASGRRA